MRSRCRCSGIGVFDKVKEFFGGFFEEVFEAVSYMIITVIVLTAFELKVGLESGWDNVWGSQFNGGYFFHVLRRGSHGDSGFEGKLVLM